MFRPAPLGEKNGKEKKKKSDDRMLVGDWSLSPFNSSAAVF